MTKLFHALAAIACLCAVPALAGDLPQPAPMEATFPSFAGHCFTVEMGLNALSSLKANNPAGHAIALIEDAPQPLADEWRVRLGQPTVKVSVILVWVETSGAAAITEYDPKGCLATATTMEPDQWHSLIGALASQQKS